MNDTLSEALSRALAAIRPDLAPQKPKKVKAAVTEKLRSIHLEFQEGSSDKVYNVEVVQTGKLYEVRFEYGRRGSNLNKGTKTDNPVSLDQANTVYHKLVQEKKKKGYKEI
jgi:predicted DNA-binding WGR domain protein